MPRCWWHHSEKPLHVRYGMDSGEMIGMDDEEMDFEAGLHLFRPRQRPHRSCWPFLFLSAAADIHDADTPTRKPSRFSHHKPT